MVNRPHIIPFGDNFIYLVEYEQGKAFVVDPGDAAVVESAVEKSGVKLTHILITHHHFDHIGGVAKLLRKYRSTLIERPSEGEIQVGPVTVRVIATQGHTKDGVCYYLQSDSGGMVFTGDTLFVGGCGRVIEGDMEMMWQSLGKLAALPDETEVYVGHDYTLDNYEFALSVEPDNKVVKECVAELEKGKCCVPSTIGQEKQTNVLLQCDSAEMFAQLCRRKDVWGKLRGDSKPITMFH